MSDAEQIRRERLRRQWSQADLAEHARQFVDGPDRDKLVQQVVGRVEKGRSSRYTDAILRALELRVVLDPDGAYVEPARPAGSSGSLVISTGGSVAGVHVGSAPDFRSLAGPRDVEELGVAVGGKDGDFELNGESIGRQPRPPGLMTRDVFAVRVQNDSMQPRFKDGELVYVERRREPAVGEDGIIEMVPDQMFSPSKAFIKEIVSKSSELIVAKQHNPKKTLKFKRSEIKALYRVVPWNECFGV